MTIINLRKAPIGWCVDVTWLEAKVNATTWCLTRNGAKRVAARIVQARS